MTWTNRQILGVLRGCEEALCHTCRGGVAKQLSYFRKSTPHSAKAFASSTSCPKLAANLAQVMLPASLYTPSFNPASTRCTQTQVCPTREVCLVPRCMHGGCHVRSTYLSTSYARLSAKLAQAMLPAALYKPSFGPASIPNAHQIKFVPFEWRA